MKINPASPLSRLCQVKGYSVGALGNTKQKVSLSSLWLYHLGQQLKTDLILGLGRGWLCGASGREWSLFCDNKPSGHFQPDLGKLPWGWFCSLNKRLLRPNHCNFLPNKCVRTPRRCLQPDASSSSSSWVNDILRPPRRPTALLAKVLPKVLPLSYLDNLINASLISDQFLPKYLRSWTSDRPMCSQWQAWIIWQRHCLWNPILVRC